MTPPRTSAAVRAWIAPAIVAIFIAIFAFCLLNLSQNRHALSIVDEHIHFDTAARATHGQIPFRGALLGQDLIDEWACGVAHEAGQLEFPCGDPRLTADAIPSGKNTTGYIHYPTYFFAAAAFQPTWEAATGNDSLLDGFRAFSAFCTIAGVIACAVMAWLIRLRGASLIAATALPVAASLLVFTGTIVNPGSTSILTGALIGGTGLLWVRRGRGFIWFALAVAFGSVIAVTASLPAGGFLLAMVIVLLLRWRGRPIAGAWNPRWWQVGVISAIVLAPVIVWGRVISATATISNAELFRFAQAASRQDILVGAVHELAALHTPWVETGGIRQAPVGLVPRLLNAFSQGVPIWITVMVFGALVTVTWMLLRGRAVSRDALGLPGISAEASAHSVTTLIGIATVATIVLYPPALRISNWLTFGFDFPIVDRYSTAFAPVLAIALLLIVKLRGAPAALAAISVTSALGIVAAGWP